MSDPISIAAFLFTASMVLFAFVVMMEVNRRGR